MSTNPNRNLSAGAVALSQAGSIRSCAARLGCTTRSVSAWRSGAAIPSDRMQRRIETHFGVPLASWRRVAALGAAVLEPTPETPEAPDSPNELGLALAAEIRLNARARLREQIARLAAARAEPGLTDRTRIELERLELQASRELARLDGRDVTRAAVLGSPHFAEVQAQLAAGLVKRQLALSEAICALDPEGPSRVAELYRDFPLECAAVDVADAALLAAVDAARAALTAGRSSVA